MSLRIKKGDTVLVLSGKDKDKKGRVLKVLPKDEKVIVEGINIVKKHQKPSRKYPQGGIIERENPVHISKVMLMCPKCDKPTRIGARILEDGRKVRICKKCKEVID
ncbi:large subunit ribosomal protein L24 [Thermodesulfovibrio aggregans]|uniref:Large ribosomal subunit protein uL24 n=1 Tax=Thermodesulfovibrio aggregans TaxID=86166 RepID=A0A0U9HXS7_9BACT|nr:50S ribosomal protein L24 [Thermodesulfovibrio aggregans]GAQ95821.1 large subunit ribosomal protein L24 [Thermodesulfovibrio aggregans]